MTKKLWMGALAVSMFAAGPAFAKGKSYQATGKVLAVTDDLVTLEKGKEKWEITRSADTKVEGDLKVGEKATVMYTMSATSIEVKGPKAKAENAKVKKGAAVKAATAPAAATTK